MELTMTADERKVLIVLEGKLTVQTSPDLTAAINGLSEEVNELEIDLSSVVYIASAGLRALVGAEKLMAARDGVMRLLHPTDEVYDVFEMTGLSDVFTIER